MLIRSLKCSLLRMKPVDALADTVNKEIFVELFLTYFLFLVFQKILKFMKKKKQNLQIQINTKYKLLCLYHIGALRINRVLE